MIVCRVDPVRSGEQQRDAAVIRNRFAVVPPTVILQQLGSRWLTIDRNQR